MTSAEYKAIAQKLGEVDLLFEQHAAQLSSKDLRFRLRVLKLQLAAIALAKGGKKKV